MFKLSDGFKFCLNPAWVANMFFTLWKGKGGGGGGSAAPTTSTTYSTNIPEYARPYVENMLNATQAQIYDPSMGGFNPYVPYSTDPTKYVAGFSPLQSYAQSGAAGMTLPSTYGLATGQTLGTGTQLGILAPQLGATGANYATMATSPTAIKAYMDPYLSSSLAPQLAEARRQYDITGAEAKSAAARAGAFGGSREALMAAENRRNMAQQMNQMIGQGYNQAFNQAQQAQQFGSNLGLQGRQAQAQALATQLAAANQLAGIGGQQLAAQRDIYNLQNQFGQQQQQQQQNIINQAIQNYATAQQYPFMQLGVLNSMLRGLPMQQSSTQMYQAPPSTLAQIGSLGALGIGAYGAMNPSGQKSGGLASIKKMASGGKAITMKDFSDPQLNQVSANPRSDLMDRLYAQELLQNRQYIKSNPQASDLIAQALRTPAPMPQQGGMPPPQQIAMAPQTRTGLDTIGTGDTVQMAGGGLLAFAEGNLVPRTKSGEIDWNEMYARNVLQGANMGVDKATQDEVKAIRDQIARRDRDKWNYGLMYGGVKGLQNTSPFASVGFGKLGEGVLDYVGKQEAENVADLRKLLEQGVEGAKADQARNIQERNALANVIASEHNKAVGLANVKANQDLANLTRQDALDVKANANFNAAVDKRERDMLNQDKYSGMTPEYIRAKAYNDVIDSTSAKDLERIGKTKIPADQMPPKTIEEPPKKDMMDRLGDLFGSNKPAAPAQTQGIPVGSIRTINGVNYSFDGKGWLPIK